MIRLDIMRASLFLEVLSPHVICMALQKQCPRPRVGPYVLLSIYDSTIFLGCDESLPGGFAGCATAAILREALILLLLCHGSTYEICLNVPYWGVADLKYITVISKPCL